MKAFLPLAASLMLASHAVPVSAADAQVSADSSPERDATREQVRSTIADAGGRSDVSVVFRQSTKNPYNFTGNMTTGLVNCESLEIVVSVTPNQTIGIRVYPHYKGGYINLGRAGDASGLTAKLLSYNDRNFLFWGADNTKDVFSGYTFTLESGFPSEAFVTVMRSIRNTDKFVGELRPFIDVAAAPTK